jgi:hypothetical protein
MHNGGDVFLNHLSLLRHKIVTALHDSRQHKLGHGIGTKQGIIEDFEAVGVLSAGGFTTAQPSFRSGKANILEMPLRVKIGNWGINAASGGT